MTLCLVATVVRRAKASDRNIQNHRNFIGQRQGDGNLSKGSPGHFRRIVVQKILPQPVAEIPISPNKHSKTLTISIFSHLAATRTSVMFLAPEREYPPHFYHSRRDCSRSGFHWLDLTERLP